MTDSPLKRVYLDYNATSPMLPDVIDAMKEAFSAHFANPSSPHAEGRMAKALLEDSRRHLADLLGVTPQELIFTSGGSESNNAVLRQCFMNPAPQHLITSQIEHPSIIETCKALEKLPQIQVSYLPVNSLGQVEPQELEHALRQETSLISIMTANNETGVVQPLAALTKIAREHQIPFHTDAVQALGKLPLKWGEPGVDYATATAHKLGGPRGIGILYIKKTTPFQPLITGGKQERVRRAGTENPILAQGFALALAWHLQHLEQLQQKWTQFQNELLRDLTKVNGFFLNGHSAPLLSNTLNFGFDSLSAESLLINLDLDHIAVSTGSACSSGALEASPVLRAMGLSTKQAKSCLRVSMGWNTSPKDIETLSKRILFHVKRMYEKKNTQRNQISLS
ncbi:cysteine desulfurase family protein [Deltaproteobacteria bacterium TL4]